MPAICKFRRELLVPLYYVSLTFEAAAVDNLRRLVVIQCRTKQGRAKLEKSIELQTIRIGEFRDPKVDRPILGQQVPY